MIMTSSVTSITATDDQWTYKVNALRRKPEHESQDQESKWERVKEKNQELLNDDFIHNDESYFQKWSTFLKRVRIFTHFSQITEYGIICCYLKYIII